MTKLIISIYWKFLASSLVFLGLTPFVLNAQHLDVITNQNLIDMVKVGFADAVILAKINLSKVSFDSSETALLALKAAGVSDAVIVATMERRVTNGVVLVNVPEGMVQIEIPEGTELKVVTTEESHWQRKLRKVKFSTSRLPRI